MRKWFMTNRLYFLRGKYVSSNFTGHDRIVYRQYFPGNNSEFFVGHENSLTAVPPSGSFDLTSIKTGYAGLKIGANGGQSISRFDGATEVQITVPNMELANGTESYILGLSGLSDVGDLSNKYMQKFIIDSSDVRLKHLKLGNAHRDYYNPYWNLKAGDGSEAVIDVESAQYLETFNL
jgi:hypothetical protein